MTAMLIGWRHYRFQRWLGLGSAIAQVAAALALLLQVDRHGYAVERLGGWPSPFGIVFVADRLGAAMALVATVILVAVAITSLAGVDARREAFGYHALVQALLVGVQGAFLTGDLFNLYVWFEVMLMASFVLLSLGGERLQMKAALKYVAYNLVASILFLSGLGLLYGVAGTLNMADLHRVIASHPHQGFITGVSMLFLVAFGVKAAVFPFFGWLPASYHTPPPVVSALFAGLLTKVGVYALVRAFTLVFVHDAGLTHSILLGIATATMVVGVLGAVAQAEFRKVLSFHIVSQIGYMVLGLALFTPLALAGTVFYVVHHILVKANLFLIAGAAERLQGDGRLKDMGDLLNRRPWLAFLFLVSALSLAGLPPLSGFWAKLALTRAAIEAQALWIVVVALAVSLLTLVSMTKIWNEAFWKPRERADQPGRGIGVLAGPIAALAMLTLTLGVAGAPFYAYCERASEQLMNPALYVEAALR
jgi:multicomponent Na+:H+ antiporter subunit D